jgi:hypothetical protein
LVEPSRERQNAQHVNVPVGPWSFRLVKNGSTALGPAISLSHSSTAFSYVTTSGVAVRGNSTWLGLDDSLLLVNTAGLGVLSRINLGAQVTGLALDPSGHRLYVALDELFAHPDGPVSTIVQERNAATGSLIAQMKLINTLGPAELSASTAGVWVSARGGMQGTVTFYRASDLIAPPSPRPLSRSQIGAIPKVDESIGMGVASVVIGPRVWLTAFQGVSCDDPDTGVFLSGTPYRPKSAPVEWTPFTIWRGQLYGAGDNDFTEPMKIFAVQVPASCA